MPSTCPAAAFAARLGRLLLAATLAASGAGCAPGGSADVPPARHSVLLIVVDALRADRIGAAGYPLPTTPHLDQLAAEGVLFRNAYAPSTWTKPSMTSLFTSLYPSEHGMASLGRVRERDFATGRLPRSTETVAERFQAGGWSTFALVNQVHLQRKLGFAQGFDRYAWRRGLNAFGLNRIARDWLEGRDERPYFAWVHYLDPHWPYDSRLADEAGRFGSTVLDDPPPSRLEAVDAWVERGLDADQLAALSARYDQEVALVDAAIGELLADFERSGQRDSAWVVVTADHGEGFLEHGRLKHSYAPYEEVARVPLIIAPPAGLELPRGERSTPVSLVDLAPTLLDLAGAEPFESARGESLRPILEGREDPGRPVFLQTGEAWGIRAASSKLLAFRDGSLELYDLDADPGETVNLAAEGCDGTCEELHRQLRRFRAGLLVAGETEEEALDEADLEELRALGYL
ncbi:MAG TPA: sulfatase [Thermoanaerobaculia bacterium]|nr:sulfatase [Thermoanaerobaculia bacterium]